MRINRIFAAYVGEQRSGKSWEAEQRAKDYLKKNFAVVVMNWSGRSDNFSGYLIAEPLSEAQAEKLKPEIKTALKWQPANEDENRVLLFCVRTEQGEYKKDKDGFKAVFSFKYILRDFAGQGLKFLATPVQAENDLFFYNCKRFLSYALLIIDDAKPIFQQGTSKAASNLFRALNHAGNENGSKALSNYGLDVFITIQSFKDVVPSLWESVKVVILFKTADAPNIENASRAEAAQELATAYNDLKTRQLTERKKYVIPLTNIN